MIIIVMNIDNKRYKYPAKGFLASVTPYATAASGAALGFLAGNVPGAIAGGKLGYALGKGEIGVEKLVEDGVMYALPTNKRKRE